MRVPATALLIDSDCRRHHHPAGDGPTVQSAIVARLRRHAQRVMDLLREWDTDRSGTISNGELADCPLMDLLREWDTDRSGTISKGELADCPLMVP